MGVHNWCYSRCLCINSEMLNAFLPWGRVSASLPSNIEEGGCCYRYSQEYLVFTFFSDDLPLFARLSSSAEEVVAFLYSR